MDLYRNAANEMTRWLVRSGALTSPFVLVDVGVQGGINRRWRALGDHLTVYGFDLLEEAIAPLARSASVREHYFAMGLADRDGEQEIVVPANRYDTQLSGHGVGERRRIRIRRLDTLLREGVMPPADFIKLDCEGYEPAVLKGAAAYLAASNLVGAELESNFNISPVLPNTHFSECCDPLLRQRLLVFDIAFNRAPVAAWPMLTGSIHRPATLELLLARNLVQERDSSPSYAHRRPEQPMDPQTVLKSAIVFEAYGLFDWALYVLQSFSNQIGAVVDLEKAVAELRAGARTFAPRRIQQRMTASLRAAAKRLLGRGGRKPTD